MGLVIGKEIIGCSKIYGTSRYQSYRILGVLVLLSLLLLRRAEFLAKFVAAPLRVRDAAANSTTSWRAPSRLSQVQERTTTKKHGLPRGSTIMYVIAVLVESA